MQQDFWVFETEGQVEVKRGKRIRIENAMRQAVAACRSVVNDRPPMVLSREDRGVWLVTVRLEDWPG